MDDRAVAMHLPIFKCFSIAVFLSQAYDIFSSPVSKNSLQCNSMQFPFCSLGNAKKSFYRSANPIFGKIGRTASEDVVIHLTKSKCVPCLMYGLDACYLNKSQLNSLDFTINRLFKKLFKTNNLHIVNYCKHCFGFEMPSELWAKRITKLNEKIANCTNSFVARFSQV